MHKLFISLDRTPGRTERFLRENVHVPDLLRSSGVDSATVDLPAMKEAGFIGASCRFSREATAAALSHVALWGNIAKFGLPAHIFEDDARLCRNFDAESSRILASLPSDWDIVLWGNEADSALQLDLLQGVTSCVVAFPQDSVLKGIDRFRETDVTTAPFRLDHTLGPCGYAVSPSGAEKLLRACLPLETTGIPSPAPNGPRIPAGHLDQIMNLVYPQIRAYACFPPLCLAEGGRERSLARIGRPDETAA